MKSSLAAETAVDTHTLQVEMEWLRQIIEARLGNQSEMLPLNNPPSLTGKDFYSKFIKDNDFSTAERLLILTALMPHVKADFFDSVIQNTLERAGDFPQLGGVRGKNFRGFLPTGETVLFLIAGEDLDERFKTQQLFAPDHRLHKKQIVWVEEPQPGEPAMSGKLILSQELVELITLGYVSPPRFGMNFPAVRVETKMEWNDLVLPGHTKTQIRDLEHWVKYGDELLYGWNMARRIKPGYRVLFHGPPGTGKTLTASLLGKYTGRDVYKIDLSLVVSKFIGETEKNLSNLFDKAENKGWILFFDEADALFGKRTNVRDAHDKYANQEVSFLLQRTENYGGLVILATNFKSNIDDAFARRFQSHIYFPAPKYNERLELWKNAFPENIPLQKDVDLGVIARQYELTGANIMNVVQYACLKTLANKEEHIERNWIIDGIKNEMSKEGKLA